MIKVILYTYSIQDRFILKVAFYKGTDIIDK